MSSQPSQKKNRPGGLPWQARTYLRHALPVFLIMCLVVLTLLPVYSLTLRQASRVVIEGLTADLNSAFRLTTRQMKTLRTLTYTLRQEDVMRSLCLLTDRQLKEEKYLSLYHLRPLTETLSSYDLLEQVILVQFRRNSALLCSTSVYHDKQAAYGSGFFYEGMTYEQWQEKLFGQPAFTWPAMRARMSYEGETREYITVNAYYSYSLSTSLVVSTLIPLDVLLDRFLPEDVRGECQVYLTDAHGGVLYDTLSGDGACLLEGENGEKQTLSGTEYLTFSCADADAGLQVAIGVPSRVLVAGVEPVLRMMNLIVAATLLCGTLYCAFYAYITFRPLMRMMNALGSADDKKGSFYAHLQRELERLRNDRTLLRERQVEMLRQMDDCALDLAFSGARLTPAEEELLSGHQAFQQGYRVVTIALDSENPEEKHAFFTRAKVLVESGFPGCEYNLRDSLMFILPEQDEAGRPLSLLFDALFRAAEKPVFMAVSAVHRGVGELPRALEETECALFRARLGVRSALIYFEPGMLDSRGPVVPFQRYTQLTVCLLKGDMATLHESMDSFRQLLQEKNTRPEWVACILGNLRTALDEAADCQGEARMDWEAHAQKSPLLQLNLMEQWGVELCGRIARRQGEQAGERTRLILRFIEENYTDSSFCLTTVADEFKLSEKYLSRFIKEQTGKNFSTHVEEVRMQRAQKLLTQTDLTVDDVARAVGYEYLNTFYKAFKRYFGCVPNNFKQTT